MFSEGIEKDWESLMNNVDCELIKEIECPKVNIFYHYQKYISY